MFEIAGMSMNKVNEAFPERRFKIMRVKPSIILNIMQGFSKYRQGDCVTVPDVQFPQGTEVLHIRPDFMSGTDSWCFLLTNPAWDSIEQGTEVPDFKYNVNTVHVIKPR